MPLTKKVSFTAMLQSASTVQIPKLLRWRFKMETAQALNVGANFFGLHRGWQLFYAKLAGQSFRQFESIVVVG
jgi:hypothetical protein